MSNMEPKLTGNEKLVLWGLLEYPGLNDIELSKKLGIRRRTVNTVKTRLKNNGVFSTLIIPDFNFLGCEILTVLYATFNPLINYEDRKEGVKKIMECEEIIHAYSTESEAFVVSISKNFTEFMKKASEILRFYEENNFIEKVTQVYFPLEISEVRFFGFSGLLKTIFKLNVEREKRDEKLSNKIRLTKRNKKVLYALVKFPDARLSEIAGITGIASHTVGRIKRKLLENGIINIFNVPNLDVLDCEMLALIHVKYKLNKINDYENQPADVFKIRNDAESISLSLFENYIDYKDYYNRKLEHLRENNLITEKPIVHLFPVKKLNIVKNFSFAPLVKKLIGVDAGF
ncbi:hypothetical protein BEH94_01050 [Candidatus Altiarchaeales archaeon WOR_SM1_SCG]|nr:hypothetical protein BEH94_01050 [Candidatus Altiarchaeales archaeon WOR_SM1_SCG]